MKYQIFSENEWVYPDGEIIQQGSAELYCARGADVCFQVLTDKALKGENFSVSKQKDLDVHQISF